MYGAASRSSQAGTLNGLADLFNKTPKGILYGLRRHYERLRDRGPGRDW